MIYPENTDTDTDTDTDTGKNMNTGMDTGRRNRKERKTDELELDVVKWVKAFVGRNDLSSNHKWLRMYPSAFEIRVRTEKIILIP